MIDKELFELCKQVYEQFPQWGLHIVDGEIASYRGDLRFYKNSGLQDYEPTIANEPVYDIRYIYPVPLYTSDYLLEKLPPVIFTRTSDGHNPTGILTVWINGDKTAHAAYVIPYDEQHRADHAQTSDTPLKALLKLTLSLNKAGVEL